MALETSASPSRRGGATKTRSPSMTPFCAGPRCCRSRMEPGLTAAADALIDRMPGQAEAALIGDFAAAIPVQIIGNLLDIPMAERAPLRDLSLAILGALEPAITPAQLAAGNRVVEYFSAFFDTLIAPRRAAPGGPESDVLTRLIRGQGPDAPLSPSELIQNCIFILNAGHETTTNPIGNGLALLDDFPDQKRLLLGSRG